MKKIGIILLIISGVTTVLVGCGENEIQDPNINGTENGKYQPNENETTFEQLIMDIDSNDSLSVGNSLFYSRDDGSSVEVKIFINNKNETVKIVEKFTGEGSGSICTRMFYLKEGKKFASKEYVDEGEGENACFAEKVSYYDDKESVIASKKRTAPYEENLDQESFVITEKNDCSMERALNVINQNGEFTITFRGFIKEDPYLYVIVGENEPNGYYSSLVVQFMDETIKKLQMNEKELIGKPLVVSFETVDGGQGYEYQMLMSIAIR